MTSKPVLITLIISITLNLLVAGAVIGHFLRGGPEPRFPGYLGRVMENIDPEQRAAMKDQFQSFRREGRELHKAMRQQQRALTQAILEEPFDEDSARAGFEKLRQTSNAVQTQMQEQMISVMKNLGPEERARLIRRLHREHRDPGDKNRDRMGDHPPP